jgi:peptide/nickel transport system permease protein
LATDIRSGRAYRRFVGARQRVPRRPLLGQPGFAVGVSLLALLVGAAVFGALLWRHDPLAIDLNAPLASPSWTHPMGTDSSGRDIFARFNEGARISLGVAAVVALSGVLVGGTIGLAAGMLGGAVDAVLSRILDAMLAFPPLILAMTVTVGLGVGLKTATLGLTLSAIPLYGRLIRSDVLRIRALPHVEAALALGAKRSRVALVHVFPHTASTLLIQTAASFGYAILSLAGLGYVGLGAQMPTPEWGAMITDGQQYALTGQWWIALFPGLGLMVAMVAVNLLADSARDRFDPRGELGRSPR